MTPASTPARLRIDPALIIVLAGVCAALHVGKLPPAITALQQALGMSLLQAGFMLSLVQVAGMSVGVLFGIVADGLGLRRSVVCGLLVLALASALGGWAREVPMLMVLRAFEGFGFLLVALPAPGLIRQLVAPQRLSVMLGLWSAYMPFATALALPVDLESVLARAPQVILSLDDADPVAFWARFDRLEAVALGNVYRAPADALARPSPRIAGGAADVCARLDEARAKDASARLP